MNTYRKYKSLIPSIVLFLLTLWTFLTSFEGAFHLTNEHLAGFVAVVISCVSFFVVRRYYKYILGMVLLLGLINLINFTPVETTISIKFWSLKIGCQPVSFFVCILTILLFIPIRSEVTVIKSGVILEQNQARHAEDVEKFRKLFVAKSSSELNEIIDNTKYTIAAKEAAREMLDQRRAQ